MRQIINIRTVKNKIIGLNKPLIGSFGEYLFADYILNKRHETLEKKHKDGSDFKYHGSNIDVGTRRNLNKNYSPETIRNKDVFVFFNKDCCVIEYPSKFAAKINWEDVSLIFQKWSNNHIINAPSDKNISYEKEYAEIKGIIDSFFAKHGFKAKVIYRTVYGKFRLNESPDNLLPKTKNKCGVSVYVDFRDSKRINENINFIIAFPDLFASKIPRQKKVILKSGNPHVKKVDLMKIKQTKDSCFFENINQLKKEFFRRYPFS